jgi:hypothetical protein
MAKRKRKSSAAGWRVSKGGGLYRAKGKTASRKKTHRTKAAAKKAARRK